MCIFFLFRSPWYITTLLDLLHTKCQKVNTVCALSHNKCHVCFGWKNSECVGLLSVSSHFFRAQSLSLSLRLDSFRLLSSTLVRTLILNIDIYKLSVWVWFVFAWLRVINGTFVVVNSKSCPFFEHQYLTIAFTFGWKNCPNVCNHNNFNAENNASFVLVVSDHIRFF